MADMLDDLKTYLITNGIGSDSSIKLDNKPEDPDDVIVLSEYPGNPINFGEASVDRNVQIIVRNTSRGDAHDICWSIFNLFEIVTDTRIHDLTSTRFAIIYSKQAPYKMGVDEKGRYMYVFNMGVTSQRD